MIVHVFKSIKTRQAVISRINKKEIVDKKHFRMHRKLNTFRQVPLQTPRTLADYNQTNNEFTPVPTLTEINQATDCEKSSEKYIDVIMNSQYYFSSVKRF